MAISIGNTSNVIDADHGTDVTWSHTIAANDNRILVVGVGEYNDNSTSSAITFNGDSLTKLNGVNNIGGSPIGISFWYLVNPEATTADIVITVDPDLNHDFYCVACDFYGVDTSDPIGNSTTSYADTGYNASITLTTTSSDDLIVAFAAWYPAVGTVSINSGSTLQVATAGDQSNLGTRPGTAGSDTITFTASDVYPRAAAGMVLQAYIPPPTLTKWMDVSIATLKGILTVDRTVTQLSQLLTTDIANYGFSQGQRGLTMGGATTGGTRTNVIEYITINSAGNAADFGDTTSLIRWSGAVSNGPYDRGLSIGKDNSNIIDYVTISTLGNAIDFGDLTSALGYGNAASNGSGNIGVLLGGYDGSPRNYIDYVNIATTGNSLDFGDLSVTRYGAGATSNDINNRAVATGGYTGAADSNVIDYITINSTGNATDFGDLTVARRNNGAASNGINNRGVSAGGYDGGNRVNTIDYFTISTPGNATDFGDCTDERYAPASESNLTDERGVIHGGQDDATNVLDTIDYITINSPGNASDFGDMVAPRYTMGGLSNSGYTALLYPDYYYASTDTTTDYGDRGLFHAGCTGSDFNIIDYITISTPGNAIDFGDAASAERNTVGTSNGPGQVGTFNGGATVDEIRYTTINTLGNSIDFGNLITTRNGAAALSNGANNRGICAGGSTSTTTIDYYTITIPANAADFGDLNAAGNSHAATSNATNERGIFAGGASNRIEYITVSSLGNGTDFGDLNTDSYTGDNGISNGTNERGVRGPGSVAGDLYSVVNIDYFTINSPGNAVDFGDLPTGHSYYQYGTDNQENEMGIFAGGTATGPTYVDTIEYITINSAGNGTDFGDLTQARRSAGSCSNAGRHQRMPGYDRGVLGTGFGTNTWQLEYITLTSLTNSSDFGDFAAAIGTTYTCSFTSNGPNDRGIRAGGGQSGSESNIIEYFTISVPANTVDFGDLNFSIFYGMSTSNHTNDRGVTFGGNNGGAATSDIDYYTISTTGNATDFGYDLNTASMYDGATSNNTNERAVYGVGTTAEVPTIEYFTINSPAASLDFGDKTRSDWGARPCSNGTNERAIFGAGTDSVGKNNIMDYITINSTGNATDFGDATVSQSTRAATSNFENERGIWAGGHTGTKVIDYVTISTIGNAVDFGDLHANKWGLNACSNA